MAQCRSKSKFGYSVQNLHCLTQIHNGESSLKYYVFTKFKMQMHGALYFTKIHFKIPCIDSIYVKYTTKKLGMYLKILSLKYNACTCILNCWTSHHSYMTFADYVQLFPSRVRYQGQGQGSVIDRSQSPAHDLELFACCATSGWRLWTFPETTENTFCSIEAAAPGDFLFLGAVYKFALLSGEIETICSH